MSQGAFPGFPGSVTVAGLEELLFGRRPARWRIGLLAGCGAFRRRVCPRVPEICRRDIHVGQTLGDLRDVLVSTEKIRAACNDVGFAGGAARLDLWTKGRRHVARSEGDPTDAVGIGDERGAARKIDRDQADPGKGLTDREREVPGRRRFREVRARLAAEAGKSGQHQHRPGGRRRRGREQGRHQRERTHVPGLVVGPGGLKLRACNGEPGGGPKSEQVRSVPPRHNCRPSAPDRGGKKVRCGREPQVPPHDRP